MEDLQKHIPEEKLFDPIYPTMQINWEKPKADFWESIEQSTSMCQKKRTRKITLYAVAASLALLIGLVTFIKLSSTTVKTQFGEHKTVVLPDGSTAVLNAESALEYKKHYWKIARDIKLEGEAFFQVEKGRPFTVTSKNGTTRALGTSFNIYNRNSNYQVTCITGKVQVELKHEPTQILNASQQVSIKNGSFNFLEKTNANNSILWKDHKFAFNGESLSDVFKEVERQYNVSIIYASNQQKSYTGIFPQKSISKDLAIICKPFGLNVEKTGNYTYTITSSN